MPRLYLREVTEEEEKLLREWANSRSQEVRLVQRAKMLVYMIDNPKVSAGRAGFQVGFKTGSSGCLWARRFNEGGLEALNDIPRPGRPAKHTEEVRSRLIDLALQKPESLGLPFKLWTVERLQREYKVRHNLHLAGSTLWEWMKNEGLEWKRQQTWFKDPDKHDPQFVEKRGLSSNVMSTHHPERG